MSSYVIHGANPKTISQVNFFMRSLIFIIGPQFSDFVTDLMTLPKTRDQTMTGDETGHGTGEDFTNNFIM